MSDLFDDDPRAAPARNRAGRSRALLITAIAVVVALFGLTGFASIYTDRIWYNNAGYGQVFSTMLWTRILLFLAFGAVLGGAVALNVFLAYRFRPLFRPTSREQSNLDRYRDVVTPIRTWLVVGIAVVVGAFAGASGMSHWRTYLLWRNGSSVGTDDPYFQKDVGFYLFDLPWWHFVVDFTMATMVLAIIAALVTHYLYGGVRLQATQDKLSGAAQAQLSVLLGLFVLAKGVDYYLDRFDLVTQKNNLFTGMNYTGENAVLPAKNILMAVAVICAILFFLNVWRRTWQLPSIGLALLALSAVLIGMIFPAAVQQFQVKPSEADKEEPYIQKNIEATRMAYDLEGVESEPYSPDNAQPDGGVAELISGTSSVPSVDPKLLSPAFENLQQQFGYYSVPSILDVDRYEVDGKQRALVLGVRELDQSGLNDDARNWSNLHTVYTHGNGIIAAYANQRDRDDATNDPESADSVASGGIEWAQGLGIQDDLTEQLGDYESRVYYGEKSPDYSVVGKAKASDNDNELNLPVPGSDLGENTTYEGDGDASVGSTFNQLMFAIKFGEPNFLLSGRVNENSQVLYVREPQERVEKVAPWLTVDADAYPAIVDGRIQWIVDAYTTTDRFPNAQRASFETMTRDALQDDTGLQTLPTDEINYMRNAVKATVDAYSGEVRLYAWDDADPMLKAWRDAFPGTVLDKSEMSEELLAHVRYPEDLFKVQRYQFARYHVTAAKDWFENNDRWAVPTDPEIDNTYQAPYRLFVGGTEPDNFALTSVYVPFNRNNLASFVSVNSDGTSEDYGKMTVLELSNADSDESDQTSGPSQVANEFANSTAINNALTDLRINAKVTLGNMLTFPVADSMMFVQPVYAQNQQTEASYPELRYVLVKYGNDDRYIGLGQTLPEALRSVFGATDPGTTPGDPDPDPDPGAGEQTLQQLLDRAVDSAITAFENANAAREDGDFQGYLDQVEVAEAALERAAGYRDQISDGADPDAPPPTTPTDGASDGATGGATDTPTEDPSAAGGS
ncbi:UPF0182 family protein [Nocardioides dongxiaopingii]|uniref:UPF0182 family membrane protein n=1 Tax=Nocardioides TaxID=1839 RepID=UPI0010C76667|nr:MULTISPECIES: UPF0182 family protein [Nocardioides]QCW50333.1 UPF0182 family protein [Nocardioides sp. S-1144]